MQNTIYTMIESGYKSSCRTVLTPVL